MKLMLMVSVGAVCSACGILAPGPSKPAARAELEGLSYELSVVETAVDSFPLVVVEIRNMTAARITREIASGCMLWPRVYRDGDWGRPTWDWARIADCASIGPVPVDLAPGEIASSPWWTGQLHPVVILGDSLQDGRYVPGALIRPGPGFEPSFVLVAESSVQLAR